MFGIPLSNSTPALRAEKDDPTVMKPEVATPLIEFDRTVSWAGEDSNLRPTDYELLGAANEEFDRA
jgi:hypothetical protein